MRIIFYYQTFIPLTPILIPKSPVTHIHVASIHFGYDSNRKPYIHLNDNLPYDTMFNNVWRELKQATKLGIKVNLLIGGAGGAFQSLFSNFELFYPFLYDLLKNKSFISGVNLDIEEECSLDNVKLLIRRLKEDFQNNLSISMAPIQSSLETDEPGMGGFVYKDLLQSPEGKLVDYFNVQFYSDFSFKAYENVIANGYLPEMVVMGALAGETNDNEVSKTAQKYKSNFGGVNVWEYYQAKPTPLEWAKNMHSISTIK